MFKLLLLLFKIGSFESLESTWILHNSFIRVFATFFKNFTLDYNTILTKIFCNSGRSLDNILKNQDLVIPLDEKRSRYSNLNINSFFNL